MIGVNTAAKILDKALEAMGHQQYIELLDAHPAFDALQPCVRSQTRRAIILRHQYSVLVHPTGERTR